MAVGEFGDLGQMGDTEDLMGSSKAPKLFPDDGTNPTTDALVDFIEDQGGNQTDGKNRNDDSDRGVRQAIYWKDGFHHLDDEPRRHHVGGAHAQDIASFQLPDKRHVGFLMADVTAKGSFKGLYGEVRGQLSGTGVPLLAVSGT